jgi:hypothetical protein
MLVAVLLTRATTRGERAEETKPSEAQDSKSIIYQVNT